MLTLDNMTAIFKHSLDTKNIPQKILRNQDEIIKKFLVTYSGCTTLCPVTNGLGNRAVMSLITMIISSSGHWSEVSPSSVVGKKP